MSHVLRAARIHLVTWPYALLWPWAILAVSFTVNLLIFSAITEVNDHPFTGGLLSIYIVQFIVFAQLFTRTFGFAAHLSFTRRAYFLGTWTAVVVIALVDGIALTLLSGVEALTDDWGVKMPFFGVFFLEVDNPVLQVLVYAGPFLLAAGIAALYGLIGTRWGSNGVLTAATLTVFFVGLVSVTITWGNWWADIGSWIADQTTVALFTVWPLVVAAGAAALAFLVARRTSF